MRQTYVPSSQIHARALPGEAPSIVIARALPGEAPSIVITSPRPDRDKDRAMPERLRMAAKVPVLYAHDYSELPVGETVHSLLEADGKRRAWWRWLEGDERAARVKNAFEQDMLSASIGVAVDWREANAFEGIDFGGEIIEFSLCAVPANPDCTRRLRAMGLYGRGDGQQVIELPEMDARTWAALQRRVATAAERSHGGNAGPSTVTRFRPGDVVLELADGPTPRWAGAERIEVDERLLRAILEDLVPRLYTQEVRPVIRAHVQAAINKIRGRVD